MSERDVRETIEWGVATRRRPGEAMNGDLGVVAVSPKGCSSRPSTASGTVARQPAQPVRPARSVRERASEDLVLLIERCHDALRDTRGAVIGLAFMSHLRRTMTWLGMGNIEGLVLSADPSATSTEGLLALGSGVLGHELPSVRTATLDVRPGDVLILATDGIELPSRTRSTSPARPRTSASGSWPSTGSPSTTPSCLRSATSASAGERGRGHREYLRSSQAYVSGSPITCAT